jgi:flagellar hook-length control protein FliK
MASLSVVPQPFAPAGLPPLGGADKDPGLSRRDPLQTTDGVALSAPPARPETVTRAAPTPQGPAETALARSASEQISARVSAEGGGFELALHPDELGRVHLHLHRGDQGSTLSIQADRPETLDLLRRNIAMLEQDLRALGHDGLTFRFSGGSADGGQQGETPRPFAGLTAEASAEPAPTPTDRQAAGTDRLDLRL